MNKNKLLACLAEHGETRTALADLLGISRVTLSRKMNDSRNSSFTQPEISAIKQHYNLTCEQVDAIFFA